MADLAVQFDLVTPFGTISFNDSGTDNFNGFGPNEYYLTEDDGLDGAPLRTPTDMKPQAHGGLVHNRYKGPRLIILEGALVVRSTRIPNSKVAIWNQMEEDLMAALSSIEQADGTLSWTPRGLSTKSLTVKAQVSPTYEGIEWRTFSFGLIAANPVW